MRMVPAAMPVRSATSLMASSVVMSPCMRRLRAPSTRCECSVATGRGTSARPAGFIAARGWHVPLHVTCTILLTGATGYVGGQLLPRLLDAGHDVRCLVRDADRARRSLPDAERLTICEGDVHDGSGLDEAA